MKEVLLITLIILAAGCTGGIPETPEEAQRQANDFLACGDASFEITSARWSGTTLSVALENDGSIDLMGFEVVSESSRGTITVHDNSMVPAGGTNTITVTTVDEPESVTVVSQECTLVRDSSTVQTD